MNAIPIVEKYPIACFVCSSLVLTYIWGFWWTVVLLITLYLIDETFKDIDEEKIYGKHLQPHSEKKLGIIQTNANMFPNHNKPSIEKRPSLQELIHLKRGKDNVTPNSRQPLAAIVKNNMNIKFSNDQLEKRKPLYTTIRTKGSPSILSPQLSRTIHSPLTSPYNNSPSLNRLGSPSLNRSNLSGSVLLNRSNLNASQSVNRTNLNTSINTTMNNSVASPLNNSLEVHGSYFINKSVLHSPATEIPALPSSGVPFLNSINKSSSSILNMKSSTAESVVEALKQKSKRKRATVDSSDEGDSKKKKTEVIDSTLLDLLPNNALDQSQLSLLSSKRKTTSDKEVTSIGTQCTFEEEDVTTKKKKVRTEKISKYGLSQNQIDELSSETESCNAETMVDTNTVDESEGEHTDKKKGIESNTTLNQDTSFKSVSFAETPNAKKKIENLSKSHSKLSALKNMESPYKRLFKEGSLKNITPESIKKMRKHPMYFTAKINVDEIQQHREEFGESGVSLKAFRLDKEEAVKRIDSLFDDGDDDVDFTLKSVSVTTSSFTITSSSSTSFLTSSDVKANLFGSATSSSVISSSTPAPSTFSFGSISSLATTNPVSSVSLAPSSISIASLPSLLNSLIASTVSTVTAISIAPTATINFGGLTATSLLSSSQTKAPVVSTQAITKDPAPSIPTLGSTTSNFSFGTTNNAASLGSSIPSLSFPSVSKPVTSIPSFDVLPSLSAPPTLGAPPSLGTQPPLGALPSLGAPPVSSTATTSLPSASQFNFSFKPQPTQTTNPSIAPVTQTSSLAAGSFSFGATSVASLPARSTTSVSSGFSLTPASMNNNAPSATSTVPTNNLFGGAKLQGTTFGASSTPAVAPSLFGASSAPTASIVPTATFQTSGFTASAAPPSTQSSIFGAATSSNIFNQPTKTTAPAGLPAGGNIFAVPQSNTNGFSFGATTVVSAPAPTFSLPSTASAASTGGFSFTTTSATSGFSFGNTAAPSAGNVFSVSSAPAPTAPTNNIFGQAVAPTANPQPSQNIFGASATSTSTSSQNVFGAPAPATSASSQNVFGAAAPSKNIFGAQASSAPATQNIFGGSTQNAFRSNTQSNNAFGSSTTGPNVFGGGAGGGATQQSSMFGAQSKPATGFSFGAPAVTTAAAGGFSFGTTATSTASNSVFGQTNNVFGNSTATNNSNVFGAAKPAENPFSQPVAKQSGGFDFSASIGGGPTINFGAAAPAPKEMPKPSFNFGSQPATPTFGGTPASPAFGAAPQPAFGSPQPFGTPPMNPAGAGGGFTIGSGTSNPPPTRQTQRARRRLRR